MQIVNGKSKRIKRREFEQKFLFNYLPYNEIPFKHQTIVHRNYISCEPELRINRRVFDNSVESYHLIYKKRICNVNKSDMVICSEKVRIPLTSEEYNEFSDIIEYNELIFDAYDFFLDSTHVIGFKCCRDPLVSFAEIEYLNEDDYCKHASLFSKLPFLKENVSSDDSFNIRRLWEKMNHITRIPKTHN